MRSKEKKRVVLILAVVLCLISVSACGNKEKADNVTNTTENSTKVVKMASTVGQSHPYSIAYRHFADLVTDRTDGEITFEYYWDGTLGGDKDLFEAMQANSIQSSMIQSSSLAAFAPNMAILDLPYLFPSREVAYKVLEGEVGQELLNELNGTGVVAIDYWDHGFFNLTNNVRPVEKLEDMNGLNIRTHGTPVQMETYKALGMLPATVSFSELYTALQQGVIDAQGNTIPNIMTSRVYEVQDYMTDIHLFYFPIEVEFSQVFMDSLTDEQKDIIYEAAHETRDWLKEFNAEEEEKALAELEEKGINISEMSDEELQKCKDATTYIYTDMTKDMDQELLRKVLEAVEAETK